MIIVIDKHNYYAIQISLTEKKTTHFKLISSYPTDSHQIRKIRQKIYIIFYLGYLAFK